MTKFQHIRRQDIPIEQLLFDRCRSIARPKIEKAVEGEAADQALIVFVVGIGLSLRQQQFEWIVDRNDLAAFLDLLLYGKLFAKRSRRSVMVKVAMRYDQRVELRNLAALKNGINSSEALS